MIASARIGLDWPLTSFSGWGVFGLNLAMTLKRRGGPMPVLLRAPGQIDLDFLRQRFLAAELAWARNVAEPARQRAAGRLAARIPVLHPLGTNLDGDPAPTSGAPDIGMVFLEATNLSAAGYARAARYAGLIAGSTWLADLLRARGIAQVVPVLQGIDPTLFHPGPRTRPFGDRFIVYSGGKLELRKGQDLVIEAFRRFRERHDDALLVTTWQNGWPQTVQTIVAGGRVPFAPTHHPDQGLDIDGWLTALGLPDGSHLDLRFVQNAAMPAVLREADVAVLPSRAEGGTNLVAMECMAVGVPTIVSANTGHADLLALEDGAIGLRCQKPVTGVAAGSADGWGESDIDEIVAAMEMVRADPAAAARRGARTAAWMASDWTWDRQVGLLMDAVAAVA